ncbi:transposase [Sphaerotilus microaerophilus]|uniref:Transposase n=1 Tax=Sphaerotilus microaerophilus TaxID=2914710 RepID=A0ABM7YJJ0_9BURK|nr:transposase [Sphaerotilus sp. FB-5]BDI04471.1 hypothetical protein CATMQ487_14410 [Sphaerotilus sp. FB-5]
MQPSTHRRVHGAQLKAQVIAACHAPGASVAAVALAHGLNANLVRKWLIGRGLKLAGAPLRFMPVELATQADAASATVAGASAPASGVEATEVRHFAPFWRGRSQSRQALGDVLREGL